ncbi:MAG: response regulator [Thermoanaerobaculia bacterium]
MSLLGRLEDLSLTDIIQIVFLSRRTGVLEVIDGGGRHTVLFRHGLVVNASAPEHPDLITFLHKRGNVQSENVRVIRQMEDSGIPCGNAVIDLNLIAPDDLTEAIRERVLGVITPLLQSREGEFNFILSESMNPVDMEYEPDALLKDGGFAPQKIIGVAEGEKIKPLRGLEESLKAGKALLRGNAPAERPALDLGLGAKAENNVVPFPDLSGAPVSPPAPAPATKEKSAGVDTRAPPPSTRSTHQFKVAGGLFEIETPDATYRNVILFERDPMVRVAAKRAFSKHNVKIAQFGSIDAAYAAMTDLFRSNRYFVTFLELTNDDSSVRLMQALKRKSPRLPVVLIDRETNLRRRHALLRAGADLYVTRPSEERMQPGTAEEELALFADELVLFAQRSFEQWEQMTGNLGFEAGKKFYEIGARENVDRSFGVLKQLINELSNPNDIGQVAATILRLAGSYLERGALFMATDDEFIGLGGLGVTGGGESMEERIKSVRINRTEPSILADVAGSKQVHRGKIRKSEANVKLIGAMGNLLPTEVVALPIMHNERCIGILYGDNAEHRAPIDNMTGLEIFLSQAGYAFGNAVSAWQKTGRGREGT